MESLLITSPEANKDDRSGDLLETSRQRLSKVSISEDPFSSLQGWKINGISELQGVKQGSTFKNVVLLLSKGDLQSYSTGKILIGVDAVVWQGTCPESYLSLSSVLSLAMNGDDCNNNINDEISYRFDASDLAGEITKIDSSGNEIIRSGLRVKLQNGVWIAFYFAADDTNRSRRSCQRCTTLLKCLVRTVIVRNAAKFSLEDEENENNMNSTNTKAENQSNKGNDDNGSLDLSEKRKKKKSRSKRRTSLTLDALQPFLDTTSDVEDSGPNAIIPITNNIEENHAHSSTPTKEKVDLIGDDNETSVSPTKEKEKDSLQVDIKTLVRKLVQFSPDAKECVPLAEEISKKFNYEISLVKTPSRKRLKTSPPQKRPPSKSDLYKLKPIVVEMSKRSRSEKREIQAATQVTIKSPKGDVKYFQYWDADTNQSISPHSYEERYRRYLFGGVDVETQNFNDVSNVPKAKEKYSHGLKIAENAMHKAFDEALKTFLNEKRRLETLYGISISDVQPELPKENENENEHKFGERERRGGKDKDRRNSLSFTDIQPLLQEDNSSKRVLWSGI